MIVRRGLTLPAAFRPLWKSVTFSWGRTVSSPYSFGALWKPRASPREKSIGDLRPAPTMREIPFDAPMAESRVILLGSNSFFRPLGDEERDPGCLSLDFDRDRDRDIVPRKACLSDVPRGNADDIAVLVKGVSVEDARPSVSLPLGGVVSDVPDSEDRGPRGSLVVSVSC